MIGAISNVSFGEATAQDLINSPGKYSVQPKIADTPADSFESESSKSSNKKGLIAAGTALVVALAAFAGLGYAVKSGKLTKIENTEAIEGTFKKLWAKTKNVGFSIGEYAEKCYNNTLGKWFNKSEDMKVAVENATTGETTIV